MNQITEYIIVPIGYNSLFLSCGIANNDQSCGIANNDQSCGIANNDLNQSLRFLMFLILFLNRVQSKKHIVIASLICYLATKDAVIRTMLFCFTYSPNIYESVIIGAGTTLIMQAGMTRDAATVFHIATLFLFKNPPTLNIIDSYLSSHIKSPLPDI
jgi:hypothetical protein